MNAFITNFSPKILPTMNLYLSSTWAYVSDERILGDLASISNDVSKENAVATWVALQKYMYETSVPVVKFGNSKSFMVASSKIEGLTLFEHLIYRQREGSPSKCVERRGRGLNPRHAAARCGVFPPARGPKPSADGGSGFMRKYVVKRLLSIIPAILVVSVVIFLIIHLTPRRSGRGHAGRSGGPGGHRRVA